MYIVISKIFKISIFYHNFIMIILIVILKI